MKQGPLYELQAAAGATFGESDGWQVPTAFRAPADELTVLKTSVGLADLVGWGVLRLGGGDRLDFVQRMSTNDVAGLVPGQGAPTVFTTPIGRIVDLVFVVVREDDLLLLVGRGADEMVAGWLRRHIFFNDDVVVENLTSQWQIMGCLGPGAVALVGERVGRTVSDLPPFHACLGQIEGVDVTVVRSALWEDGYSLLAQADQASTLWKALTIAVEAAGGAPVGQAALETVRITRGWPRFGRELSADYIPLEAGLKWAVNFNKGCYVGQEIIARMETYQRLAKRLVVLQVADAVGIKLAAGDEVWAEGTQVGRVTSVAPLADGGMVRALAYVKSWVAEPGRDLTVGDSGGSTATVLAVSSDRV